ncbi:MAG: hypothetical protein ACR652_02830 [Methylocystis sp.]|uniref:hypothetical protein n=1 Tax=Methylocystis sp. TaxID=1911079 RepID=UPI003DA69FF4
MASLRQIYRPTVNDAFSFFLELNGSELALLKSEVQGPDSLDFDQERCARLAKQLNTDSETVTIVLGTIGYLYSHIHSRTGDVPFDQKLRALVDGFAEGENSNKTDEIVAVLAPLLEKNDTLDNHRKAQRLKVGVLDNAIGFSSFVDVRPMFSDEKTEILGFVPVIQFRIALDQNADSEKSIVFQLDEANLKRLKDAVDAIEKKIATLKASTLFSDYTWR